MKIKTEDRNPRVYGEISQVLWMLERKDEAYEYAMQGVRMPNPREINALMAGLTSFEKGNFNNATRFFRAYLGLNPNDRNLLWKLGESLIESDSLEAAKSVFYRMISLDNNDAMAYFGLAAALFRQGEYDLAEQYCSQGLVFYPDASGGQQLLENIQLHRRESLNGGQ